MKFKSIGLALAGIAFSAIIAGSILLLWKYDNDAPPEPVKKKSFSRLIAEGMRYRDYQTIGVDQFSFKNCRVEKRRKGAITFGAFNVLVVDGLVLNLPAVAPATAKGGPAGGASFGWMQGDQLGETLLRSQGMMAGRVSGIRINGLTVNRCNNSKGVSLVFSAASAESKLGKQDLQLQGCEVLTPDGRKMRVNEARLTLKPEPGLVYLKNGVEESVNLNRK
ncbi:MAG: hypothetical protein WC340_03380 [Kiritimatiellia bacterium]